MFLLYMAFCDFIASDPLNPQIFTILAFLEFLAFNNLKPPSILNYMSAIRSQFTWFNLDTQTLFHPKIKHMLRALELSNHTAPIQKAIFDVPTLLKIIETCLLFPLPLTFRALFLLAFFGFLRISNLVPPSKTSFDVTKHLCRGDIIFQDSHAIVLIKWSKTLQSSTKGTFIIIPSLGNSPLCPVTALKAWLGSYSHSPSCPLFLLPSGSLTQSQVRTHLTKILTHLQLNPAIYSFHTFRRSGATLAFNSDVNIQKIKRHGTWSSDAVNAYIIEDPLHASGVAQSFQRLLTT